MKNIISAICGFSMICGAAVADEKYITAGLNTPVQLYRLAIELCDKNLEYDEIQPFMQSLRISFGDKAQHTAVITITPAELIAQCIRVHKQSRDCVAGLKIGDEDCPKLAMNEIKEDCATLVINAINEHNSIVSMYSSDLSSPITNRAQKVKWERWTWTTVFSQMLPDDEYTFQLLMNFSDALYKADNMMSLDDWYSVCSAALSNISTEQQLSDNPMFDLDDSEKAKLVKIIGQYQFTCDKYVNSLEQIYNEQAKNLNGIKYKYVQ